MDWGALGSEVIVTAVLCIPLGLSVWALLDCARRPAWAWSLAGRSRVAWLVAILCGVLLVPAGLAVSLTYLLWTRPAVAAAEDGDFPHTAGSRRRPS
ncbi:MAG: hypothetical protein KDB33_04460 [Acidimicrobiales bacterium]|nr:hypothetical protein [Acidimicrobiales bacterium]MCB1259633.1 hypothetical protein [Acidimicrobiales bacterium]